MNTAPALRGYLAVALCYQAFTLSDGALRMLVLLHLQASGQTPLALALLLLPYEAAGVFTNLLGGWLGARLGQKPVLRLGLALQALACLLLGADPTWLTLPYVMASQVLSGMAKDLAKTAAKSYVRVLAPEAGAATLFRVVAVMTGSKNAMKGFGFFLGGALLASAGFRGTNLGLAALLLGMLVAATAWLPQTAAKPRASFRTVFAHSPAVNWLAVARMFLFGSRDAWFAVALPLFLTTHWAWGPPAVGGFLAVWVIGYGLVQAFAPKLVRTTTLPSGLRWTAATTGLLLAPLAITWAALGTVLPETWTLVGLLLYGAVFAVTSSLHSWLVVAMAGSAETAERIGFYYAANALGRLLGTLASGWLYGSCRGGPAGLSATILLSAGAVIAAAITLLPAAAAVPRRPGAHPT